MPHAGAAILRQRLSDLDQNFCRSICSYFGVQVKSITYCAISIISRLV